MSKSRKGKQSQQDTPAILDSCGCNVLDINGVHTVNFTYEINSNDHSNDVKFEGDIDFLLPFNLPKNQKLPKIEITHPTSTWKATNPVQIDDNFINTIKDKRLIFKFLFITRPAGSHKGSQRIQNSGKKGQQQPPSSIVQMPTIFFDASILLVRGGRFKPTLSCSSSYDCIPGFSNFTITISIDHPLLSDAQIRKFQPFTCLIKSVHQIPDKPMDFNDLKLNKFLPPYLIFNVVIPIESPSTNLNTNQKPLINTSSNSNLRNSSSNSNFNLKNTPVNNSNSNINSTSNTNTISYATISSNQFSADIKYNLPLLFWCDQKSTIKEIQIELHDRENKNPEGKIMIGSGFIAPEAKVDINQQTSSIPNLSLEQILDVKKDSIPHPFGTTKFELNTGRYLNCIKPLVQRNSSIIQMPFYIEAGTYVTIEIEDLASCMPDLPQLANSGSNAKKQSNRKLSLSGGLNVNEDKSKKNSKSTKPLLYHRYFISSKSNENFEFLSKIQSQIIEINSKAFDQRDPSSVSMMKIDSVSSEAVSGTILMFQPQSQMIFLEALQESDAERILNCFFETEKSKSCTVLLDDSQLFTERLYWQFDCAVKKFKLKDPIDQLLQEPEIYMQKSHLSNCFLILNQINQLLNVKIFSDITKNNLWPKKEDFEMLNAKKGQLLTLEELAFSTATPEIKNIRSARFTPISNEEKQLPQEKPQFKYTPINQDKIDVPVHDLKYYDQINKNYIIELDRKIPKKKGLINIADDGESEIWEASVASSKWTNSRATTALGSFTPSIPESSSIAQTDANEISTVDDLNSDWEIVEPEDFKSLASEASMNTFVKRLREENGSEVRNGQPFYYYRSPKSAMSKREKLLVDVNQEPWTDKDLSLAMSDQRWLKESRGEILSDFKTIIPEQDLFNVPLYQSQEDKYRPKSTFEKRNYVAKPMKHTKRFYGVVTPVKKNEPIRKGQIERPPLTLEEPYVDHVKKQSNQIQGKPRFENIYRTPIRKGDSDSLTVRKIQTNALPKINI